MINLKKYLPRYNDISETEISSKFMFTIFVPVYNSEKTIGRFFDSIERQTFKDFEVIIINDGSSDNSHLIIEDYLENASFTHRYVNNNKNVHKMGVMYQAINMSLGEYFLVHDADDSCMPNSLEIFNQECLSLSKLEKESIIGVGCCCQNQFGKLVGEYFPQSPFYSDTYSLTHYHKIKGEKWGVISVSFLKNIELEKDLFSMGFIPESFLWLTLASRGYKMKYINDKLRIYYENELNNLSGLGYENKAFGMAIYSIMYVNFFYKKHLFKNITSFVKRIASLLKSSKYLDYTIKQYIKSIDSTILKIFLVIFWPVRKLI